jgi:hypothetical protein
LVGMGHADDSWMHWERIQADNVHLHVNQHLCLGRRVKMTANERRCIGIWDKQLTDFERIHVELVRFCITRAGFGHNVQVIDCALNHIVVDGRTAELWKEHLNRHMPRSEILSLVHRVDLQADAGSHLEHSN